MVLAKSILPVKYLYLYTLNMRIQAMAEMIYFSVNVAQL